MSEYQVELDHDAELYLVEANLEWPGTYDIFVEGSGRECFEVTEEPTFGEWIVSRYDEDIELRNLKSWDVEITKKAEKIMREIYWNTIA